MVDDILRALAPKQQEIQELAPLYHCFSSDRDYVGKNVAGQKCN
jgi:hypothetical protein